MGNKLKKNVFTKVDYNLQGLISKIDLGEIALPDLQRPFIWKNKAVRDLFDSLYLGYPVGFFLFWETSGAVSSRSIGDSDRQRGPKLLVVDGQQRLTSLYAIIKGAEVVRNNFEKGTIEISFDPISEKFDVSNAATLRSHSSIPSISKLWSNGADVYEIAEAYTETLREVREVSKDEARSIRANLLRVFNIMSTPFIALELSSEIDVEEVAEVFVRVNSKGKALQQADFILTLMSVFWEQGRRDLERFSFQTRSPGTNGPSAYNHFVSPDPDVLLRVGIGLGFRRATLKYAYALLTGRDLETGQKNEEQRELQFETLKNAQAHALNLQNWHDFLNCIRDAGYRSDRMLLGERNIIYGYVIYLIGRIDFQIDKNTLARAITQWIFMSALTSRYSSSGESTMEGDLARFRDLQSKKEFVALLHRLCSEQLTDDYWNINLPTALANSSATNTAMMAYFASLTLLKAKALYSNRYVADLLDPTIHSPRSALERHHLFPRAYLEKIGRDQTERNQVANYAILEYSTNGMISDEEPSSYAPKFESDFSKTELIDMHYHHALPDNWQNLDYDDFLRKRRELISKVVRVGYESLLENSGPKDESDQITPAVIQGGEGDYQEFKSTLRRNLHTGQNDPKMEFAVLRTIAGFLNRSGGKLFVGIADDGTAVGLNEDGFPNEDKLLLHLTNLINSRIGTAYNFYIEFNIEDYLDKRALVVNCRPSQSAVWVKDGNDQKFFVRTGASTSELKGSDAQSYIEKRF